jgi:type IV pilus assembly protein PilC
MFFTYKAKTKDGNIIIGVLSAHDRFAASKEIKYRGNIPISISEKGNSFFEKVSFLNVISGKVSTKDLIIMTSNLSRMLQAGLSLSRALSVLEKQTEKNPAFNKVIKSLIADVNIGASLSSGLEKFPNTFSKLFISMVRAGEESANLSKTLNEVSNDLQKSYSLNKKIKGAMIYPAIIISVMILVGILMFAFVVPTLADTFKEIGVKLPLPTRIIIFIADFLHNNLFLTLVGLILGTFGLVSFFRASFMKRYTDSIILKLPFIGNLTREVNTARTARTMSSLLSAGISISRAIEITSEVVQNTYYKEILTEAKSEIERGSPFSEIFVLNEDLYPVMMSRMIQVGEETGKLSDMLSQVSAFYEEVVEDKTKNLAVIIEPILMVLMGIGIGFFAISMIMPLYSVLDNIQ